MCKIGGVGKRHISGRYTAKMRPKYALAPNTGNSITSIADETPVMEQKTARLTVLIDPTKKDAFEQLCAEQDVTPSQVVRQLIREYLDKHGVSYANQPTNGAANSK